MEDVQAPKKVGVVEPAGNQGSKNCGCIMMYRFIGICGDLNHPASIGFCTTKNQPI